jgi:hypothetical protein
MNRTTVIVISSIVLGVALLCGGAWAVLRPHAIESPYATWTPASEAELKRVTGAVITALTERKAAPIDALIDEEALIGHAFAGLKVSPFTRHELSRGALRALRTSSLGSQMVGSMPTGCSAICTGTRQESIGKIAVVRCHYPNGSTVYMKVRAGMPPGGGQARIMDLYMLAGGAWLSDNVAGISDQLIHHQPDGGIGAANTLGDLKAALAGSDPARAERIFRQLPDSVRSSKFGAQMLLLIVSKSGEPDQRRLMAEIGTAHGQDPSMALALIDHHYYTEDWQAVIADLDRVASEVGEDAWLRSLRGAILVKTGSNQFARAWSEIDQAHASEPDFAYSWEVQIDMSLAAGDYDRTLAALLTLERTFHRPIDLTGNDAFDGFRASPQHRTWLARNATPRPASGTRVRPQ